MADDKSGYKHSASDKKLDQSADAANDGGQTHDSQHASAPGHSQSASGPGHDPAEIAKHDDKGKDRLFEGREQHDEADKNSEKTRLAKDMAKHNHPTDDDVADAGTGPSAKRKS